MPKKMKILIVDDRGVDRRLLRKILESKGHEVQEAAEGQEGLEMLRCHKIDLIISDALMPGMDGFRFLRNINKDEKLKTIPFVFYSAVYTGRDDEKLARSLGARVFIEKPALPNEFLEKLQAVIQQIEAGEQPVPVELIAEEEEYLRNYSDVVVTKLEEKMEELEKVNKRLQREIEERKHIEEGLKQNVLEWSTAMDASDDVIYLLDSNRYLLRANKSFYLMAGSDKQSALGKHIEQILHLEEEKGPCPVSVYLAQKEKRDTLIVMEADHPENPTGRPIETTVKIVKGDKGQVVSIFVKLHDVSEQRKVVDDLRQSKEEWERTFHAFTDVVTLQDTDLRIIKANQAACTILDLPYDKIIGYHCYELFDGSNEPCHDCPLLETRKSFAPYTREMYYDKLGKTFMVSAAPVFNKQGELEYIAHVAKDVTETKQLESQLLQSQKMQAIGTLAGGIAHDFNNILSAIIGYAEFIQEEVSQESKIGKDITEVLAAGTRAAALVKQILMFSRKEATEKQVLQPHLIVQEAMKMLHATLPTTVVIQEDIDPDCGRIMADPTIIHQIIVNLCTNGLQAMAEQKGTLYVSLQRREITAAESSKKENVSPGPFVVLTVKDSGCGMDQLTIDRIFEPYFTTKEVGSGTGLGLAIVHGAVAECKGFIEVESSVGKGTVFSVYLPLAEEAVGATVASDQNNRGEILPDSVRILAVDDELLITKINAIRLKSRGYKVTAVTDSREALEVFRSQPEKFDLLITDQTMPGLTGADLAKAVLEIKPSLPIIMCTGHSDIVSEEEAVGLGIKKYVFKPLHKDELLDAVQEVLAEK
jgi:PAS domain S-box-containing protein